MSSVDELINARNVRPFPDTAGALLHDWMDDRFDELYGLADEYVNELDRSYLGSFAVSDERLIEALAKYLLISTGTRMHEVEILVLNRGKDFIAEHEVTFWRYMNHLADRELYTRYGLEDKQFDYNQASTGYQLGSRLYEVYTHPEYLRYFEAGIWSHETIESLIAADVDPALAYSLR